MVQVIVDTLGCSELEQGFGPCSFPPSWVAVEVPICGWETDPY